MVLQQQSDLKDENHQEPAIYQSPSKQRHDRNHLECNLAVRAFYFQEEGKFLLDSRIQVPFEHSYGLGLEAI